MIDFSANVRRFKVVARTRTQTVYRAGRARALASIKFGSPITGAEGQPVQSSALRDAWKMRDISDNETLIAPEGEPVKWAYQNETGIALPGGGPYRLRSKVGGRFSVAKTIAGWPAIVKSIVATLRVR